MLYGSIRKLNLITRQDQYFISTAFLIPNFPPPSFISLITAWPLLFIYGFIEILDVGREGDFPAREISS